MSRKNFHGKLYVVTGASRGIGREIARVLLQRGAEVIGVGRSEDLLRRFKKEYASFSYIVSDLSQEGSGLELASELEGMGVKGLINNAGYAWWGDPFRMPPSEVRRMTQLMFLTSVELSRALIEDLKGGEVVNIISAVVHVRMKKLTVYGAVKTALHYYTLASRPYYKKRGVHLMGVYPGPVRTEFFSHQSFPKNGLFLERFAVSPERVARAVIRGIERESRSVYVPWYLRVMSFR